jgi:ribose 1,5-bisphosphate isomerase
MNDATFTAGLRAIESDRSSGAAEIARRCLEIVATIALLDDSGSTAELLGKLNSKADLLAQSRPSMAPVANLLNVFRREIEKFRQLHPPEARKKCATIARQTIAQSVKATEKTAKNAARLIGKNKTVFTHSFSSTVLQAFAFLKNKNLQVIISESRPLCEGYSLATKLSQLKIPTTLITDAQTGLFVKKADMVLVGADTILQDFAVINKAGTYLAALAAYDNNIPLYVCSEKYKHIYVSDEIPELEAMNPEELNAPDLPHVSIENIYFDITPARLISGWINEEEVVQVNFLSPDDLENQNAGYSSNASRTRKR